MEIRQQGDYIMEKQYRGYSIKNEKWVYGDLRHYKGNTWIVDGDNKEMVYQKSVGINTGRTDIAGQAIYAGHRIKISYTYPANDGERTTERVCRVLWSDEHMGIVTDWGTESLQYLHQVILATDPEIKIVGDIFCCSIEDEETECDDQE